MSTPQSRPGDWLRWVRDTLGVWNPSQGYLGVISSFSLEKGHHLHSMVRGRDQFPLWTHQVVRTPFFYVFKIMDIASWPWQKKAKHVGNPNTILNTHPVMYGPGPIRIEGLIAPAPRAPLHRALSHQSPSKWPPLRCCLTWGDILLPRCPASRAHWFGTHNSQACCPSSAQFWKVIPSSDLLGGLAEFTAMLLCISALPLPKSCFPPRPAPSLPQLCIPSQSLRSPAC